MVMAYPLLIVHDFSVDEMEKFALRQPVHSG